VLSTWKKTRAEIVKLFFYFEFYPLLLFYFSFKVVA